MDSSIRVRKRTMNKWLLIATCLVAVPLCQAEDYGADQQWRADRQMQQEMEQAAAADRLQRIEAENRDRLQQIEERQRQLEQQQERMRRQQEELQPHLP